MTGGKHRLKKEYRNVIDAARDEAQLIGGTIEVDLVGRHPRVYLLLAGQSRLIPFASTPKIADHGVAHMRQRIRQKAREIGALE